MRFIGLTIIALLACGAAALGQHSGDVLINSGFQMRPADTPDKVARLRAFPPDKFVARKTKTGQVYYIYAEPSPCVCAYVGSQAAMDSYRSRWNAMAALPDQPAGRLRGQQFVENEMIHDMQNDDAESDFDYGAFHPGF